METAIKKLVRTAAIVAFSATMALGAAEVQAGPVPAGATCIGNCGTLGADGVVTLSPLSTPSYLYISTAGGVTGAGQIAGIGGTNGSQLTTPTFSATASDELKFYFNYVTSDGSGYADYGFAQLLDSGNNVAANLFSARTQPSGDTSPGFGLPANDSTLTPATSGIIGGGPAWSPLGSDSGACFSGGCGYTGWIEASYTIAASGTYSLLFGVSNWSDTGYDTGMAIDGVTIAGNTVISAVPEPAAIAFLGLGLAGLGFARRKRAA